MQKSIIPAQIPNIRDKQYQIKIPQEIKSVGKILGAVYTEFGDTQCLILYNTKHLYFLEICNQNVVKYSSYNIANINNLISIIKGYLAITTKDQKLWLFQLKKMDKKKQEGTKNIMGQQNQQKVEQKGQKMLTVQSFLKQTSFSAYFVRQVTPNMVELLIATANDKGQKVLYIYQFTIKQKVGGLGFTLDKNYKIIVNSRKQLYASKNFYDPSINSIIKLKNFSDLNFTVKKIQQQFLYVLPIGKSEDFVCLNKNLELINPESPNLKKKLRQQLKGYNVLKSISHLNYILMENNEGSLGLFVLEQTFKLRFLGFQSKQYSWQICFNGKLVGVKQDNSIIKVTRQLNKKNTNPLILTQQLKINENLVQIQQKNQSNKPQNIQQNCNENIKQALNKQQKPQNNSEAKKQPISLEQKNKQVQQQNQQKNKNLQSNNNQQLQFPKQKSIFKPTKIASRKGMKQIKKDQEKVSQQKQKNKQTDLQKIESQQNNISKEQQKVIEKQKIQNKSLQQPKSPIIQKQNNLKSQNQSEQKTTQIVYEKKSQNIIQKDINTQLSSQKLQQKTIESSTKTVSPFIKKKIANQSILGNQIKLPSYEQIFGNKSVPRIKQSSLFFGKKIKLNQLETPKVNPFEKKQQALIQKQAQKPIQQQNKIKNQNITQPQVKKQQPQQPKIQIQIKIEKQIPQQPKCQVVSPKTQELPKQTQKLQINDPNCCINFQQTKQSYNIFAQKISNLQNKSQQIIQKFKSLETQLIKQLTQNLSKTQKQILTTSQQKSNKLISNSLQTSVNEYFGKKLTPKINDYFKYILNDTKRIYDTTLRFYTQKKKQSIISLQNHFQEQEHLVNQMKIITGDMLACVENTIIQGEQSHAYLLKQWERTTGIFNNKLDSTLQKVGNHDKVSDQRQKIIDSLAQIKQSIINVDNQNKKQLEIKQAKEQKVKKQGKKDKEKQKYKNIPCMGKQKHKIKKIKGQKQQFAKYREYEMPVRSHGYSYPYPYPTYGYPCPY